MYKLKTLLPPQKTSCDLRESFDNKGRAIYTPRIWNKYDVDNIDYFGKQTPYSRVFGPRVARCDLSRLLRRYKILGEPTNKPGHLREGVVK